MSPVAKAAGLFLLSWVLRSDGCIGSVGCFGRMSWWERAAWWRVAVSGQAAVGVVLGEGLGGGFVVEVAGWGPVGDGLGGSAFGAAVGEAVGAGERVQPGCDLALVGVGELEGQ